MKSAAAGARGAGQRVSGVPGAGGKVGYVGKVRRWMPPVVLLAALIIILAGCFVAKAGGGAVGLSRWAWSTRGACRQPVKRGAALTASAAEGRGPSGAVVTAVDAVVVVGARRAAANTSRTAK